jgi:uncharacterized protein (TIGR03086 family)
MTEDHDQTYDDGLIACDATALVIRRYYPWGAKRIPGAERRAVRPMLGSVNQAQERYQLTAAAFDARVQAARPESWNRQSPCTEWQARDVVAHVVNNHRRLIADVTGVEPQLMTSDEDPKAAWTSAYATMRELAEDPEAMAHSVQGPTGPMPLEQLLPQFVCMDMLVHTWDLARAIGGDERLNEDYVKDAYETLKPMDAMIRQPGVFGPKLDPPPTADVQTEFLYFLGRRA